MGLNEKKIAGVPQFVSYFVPVIESMRQFEGQAQPKQVFQKIIENYEIPVEFLALTHKKGGSQFENKVSFARAYLVKAGVMTAPARGIWGLSDAGWKATLSDEWAANIFRIAREGFAVDDEEEKAPEDEVFSDSLGFWFVGASWSEGDQTERFLRDGIWQNGYEDKFSKLVRQMKP